MDALSKIDNYRIFYYVVEKGSMGRAAETLGLVPASITKSVQALEDSMNCRLFIRSTKGVALTAEGKTLYEWVRPAINLLKSGELEMRSLLALEAGTLNIGIASDLIPNDLTGVWMKKFCKRYPRVAVNVVSMDSQDVYSALSSADVDLVLCGATGIDTEHFNVLPVFKKHDVVIVGREIGRLAEHPVTIEELAKYPLIFTGSKTSRAWKSYEKLYSAHGLRFEPHIATPIVGMQVNAVRSGLGYSFIPETSYGAPAKYGEILSVTLSNMETVERHMNCYTAKDHPLSSAAQAFIDVLIDSIQK